MAEAKKCDICGSLYEPYNYKKPAKYPNYIEFRSEGFNGSSPIKLYDTCPKCMEKIGKLIFELQHHGMFIRDCRANFVKKNFNLPLEEDK